MLDEIVEIEDALGLLATAFAHCEETRQPSPCGAVLRIGEDVRRAVGEDETCANGEPQRRQFDAFLSFAFNMLVPFLKRAVGAHDARHAVAVRDADTGQAECQSLQDEFLRMRGAAQEGEVCRDGKLGISVRGIGAGKNEGSFSLFILVGKANDIAHANTPCTNQLVGDCCC